MYFVRGVAGLLRKTSGGSPGETYPAAETHAESSTPSAASWPEVQFSQDEKEQLLDSLWQRYQETSEQVESQRALEAFLVAFTRLYESWVPVDVPTIAFQRHAKNALEEQVDNPSISDEITVGCSFGHPTRITVGLVQELKAVTSSIVNLHSYTDVDVAVLSPSDAEAALRLLSALNILTRSLHNRRIFISFGGLPALMANMKAAVVQLKAIACLMTSKDGLPSPAVTQISFLKCLLAYTVSVVYNFMDAEARVIRRIGTVTDSTLIHPVSVSNRARGSIGGSPLWLETSGSGRNLTLLTSPHAKQPPTEDGMHSEMVGSVPLLETGGLNWFVELLRTLRKLRLKGFMSETSLEKLTLQTLKAAILSNPRAQNHFRSIGGLEVLLDGLGSPTKDSSEDNQIVKEQRSSLNMADVLEDFQLQILSLEVAREAVFRNVHNLQSLRDCGGILKFIDIIRWAAFTFPDMSPATLASPGSVYLPGTLPLSPTQMSGLSSRANEFQGSQQRGPQEACTDRGDVQSQLTYPQEEFFAESDDLQGWNGRVAHLCRILCSFLVPAGDIPSFAAGLIGGQDAAGISGAYWELATRWIVNVLLGVFRGGEQDVNRGDKEALETSRLLSSTLQHYVLYVFKKMLEISPSVLQLFREHGVWNVMFTEYFFFFGLEPGMLQQDVEKLSMEGLDWLSASSSWQLFASSERAREGFDAVDTEPLRVEVISFVELAATVTGSSYNLPECSALMKAVKQCALIPSIVTMLLKTLHRILQLAVEPTLTAFQQLDAVGVLSRVMEIQRLAFAKLSEKDHQAVASRQTEDNSGIGSSTFDWQQTAGREVWWNAREVMFALFGEYLSAAEEAQMEAAHNLKVLDVLFNLLWEHNTREFAFRHIMMLMKLPPTFEEHKEAKLELCLKYLEAFPRALVASHNTGISILRDLLNGVHDILQTDLEYYQALFRESECFVHIVSLLNEDHSEEAGRQLCLDVVLTLTHLLWGNDNSKVAFRELVGPGYNALLGLLLEGYQMQPNETLLSAILDMLVEGKFVMPTNMVIKNEDAILLFFNILRKCDEGLQSKSLDNFRRMLEESTANQASCVRAGLLSLLLDWFAEEQNEDLMTKVAQLMQMIGGHSISGKDIRRIFALLRSTKDGCRPRHGALLLKILQGMLIGEGPTVFFELSGQNSGISIQTPVRWPTSKGFSFCCWARVESFHSADSGNSEGRMMGLFSFLSETGKGCTAVVGEDQLLIETVSQKREAILSKITFRAKRWYFLAITHSTGRALGGGTSLRIYIDGVLVGNERLRYAKVNEPLSKCTLGASCLLPSLDCNDTDVTPERESAAFCGQLGPVYLFDDALSSQQIHGVFSLGPSYMYSFLPSEVGCVPENVGNQAVIDARDGLGSKMIFGYNAQASKGPILYDISPLLEQSTDKILHTAKILPGTLLCYRRRVQDIIHCVGGIGVFFPLLTQLDEPIGWSSPAEGSAVLRILPHGQLLSGNVVLQGRTEFGDSLTETNVAVDVIELLKAILTGNFANQQYMHNVRGLSVLGFLLQSVSPQLLTVKVVVALESLLTTLLSVVGSQVAEALVKELLSKIYGNPYIWIFTPFLVQREVYLSLLKYADKDAGQLKSVWSLPATLDVLQQFYWEKPKSRKAFGAKPLLHPVTKEIIGERPSQQEIAKLRFYVLSLAERVLRDAVTLGDTKALVAFLETSEDLVCIEDVLGMLLTLTTHKPFLIAFVEHVCSLGGCQIFLSLLRRQEESVRMLGLRIIGVLVLATPAEKKGGRLFIGRSSYDQQRAEKLKLAPLFSAIAERLFVSPFTDLVRATLFDVLLGGSIPKQFSRKGSFPQLETKLDSDMTGQSSRFGQTQSWVSLLRTSDKTSVVLGANSHFALSQMLGIVLRFMLICQDFIMRATILRDVLQLLEANPMNCEALSTEPQWQDWLFSLMVDDVTRLKEKAVEGASEIVDLMIVELKLIRRIFCAIHTYCVFSVRGGWRFVERTVNFILLYGEKGLPENVSLLQDIFADLVDAVLQSYPSQAALLAQPCRDNVLYLLVLVDELVMKDAFQYLPFLNDLSLEDSSENTLLSGGYVDLGSRSQKISSRRSSLTDATVMTTRARRESSNSQSRGWQRQSFQASEGDSYDGKPWPLYDNLWILLGAMNGRGASVANNTLVSTGPSFGQRARGLVESLNIPAAEMAAAVVAGGLGAVVGINVPNKLVDKAAKLRGEKCPKVVFRLVLLYIYEANLEAATRCVRHFLALLPVFLSAESEMNKNRLQLFFWSLHDARDQIGGMDDGARFQLISQLIQETAEHGKGILVNNSGDKREEDYSSNSASVQNLLQQDRVIAAVKEEAKHLKITMGQRAEEVEMLRADLDELLVLEAEQGRVLEEQVLTITMTTCANDRTRRISAQLSYDEDQQSISDYWCHMFRDLTEERGAWSVVPFPNNCKAWWKLDKTEDPLRRRLKLKRNYHFNKEFQHAMSSASPGQNLEMSTLLETGSNAEFLGGDVKSYLLKGLRGVSEEELLETSEEDFKDARSEMEETPSQAQAQALDNRVPADIEGLDTSLQQNQQNPSLEVSEDEVFLSISCVLITQNKKLAGRLDIMQSTVHFYGEFLVEGTGGSATFTTSGALKKPDIDHSEASSRRGTRVLENSDSWVGDVEKESPVERTDPVLQTAEHGLTNVKRHRRWQICQVKAVHGTRYLLKYSALEIFFSTSSAPVFFNFPSQKCAKDVAAKILLLRNEVYFSKSSSKDKEDMIMFIDKRKAIELAERAKEQWRRRDINNFEYLMTLNSLAGRSHNDLTQYPVFPWVIADYSSEKLDFLSSATFRDFSKPVGALDEKRFEVFEERYQNFSDPDIPSFYYGSHYSSMGIVLFYLIRLEPFTTLNHQLQGGKFDHADRLFHSIEGAFSNCLANTSDVKELIPEFFYLPEFLNNSNDLCLGIKQDGHKIGDVILPPWAKGSAEEFIQKSREGLESEYVSEHLHEWIDLIFGCKQRGKAAVEAANVFYHLTYEGAVDLEAMDDPLSRAAVEDQIANFGQTPIQLFRRRHPKRGPPIPVTRPLYYAPASITLTSSLQCFPPQGRQDHVPLIFVATMDNKVVIIGGDLTVLVKVWITPPLQGGGSFTFSSSQEPFFGIGPDVALSRKVVGPYGDGVVASPACIGILHVRSASYLLTCGHWDNSFKGMSLQDGRMIQSNCYHKDVVLCLSVAIDGSVVVTGSRDTTVMVWDVEMSSTSGSRKGHGDRSKGDNILLDKPRHVLCGHDDAVTCVAVRVELDLVVSGSNDKTCILHTLRKGAYLRSIMHPSQSPVSKVAVSQHGLIVVYSSDDLNLRVCSVNGKWLAASDSNGRLNCMDISSCGEFLVCGGEQGQVVLRQLHSLEILRRYDAIGQPISCLAVTPEDCFLVGTQYGNLHVYSIEPQQQRKGSLFFAGLRNR